MQILTGKSVKAIPTDEEEKKKISVMAKNHFYSYLHQENSLFIETQQERWLPS